MVRTFAQGLLVCSLGLFVAPSYADFNNGNVETFDGTVIDTNHYRQNHAELMSQNNALFITAAANEGIPVENVTTTKALGVGGVAQVQVTVTAKSPLTNFSHQVYLALTTDTSTNSHFFDSYGVASNLSFNAPGGFTGSNYSNGSGTGDGFVLSTSLNTLYSLKIERLSDTSVYYAVLNSSNTILSQTTRVVPSYASPLFISIGGTAVNASFDNLTLTGNVVPEPASAALLLLAGGFSLTRRRRASR
jgi:hypothetical protein